MDETLLHEADVRYRHNVMERRQRWMIAVGLTTMLVYAGMLLHDGVTWTQHAFTLMSERGAEHLVPSFVPEEAHNVVVSSRMGADGLLVRFSLPRAARWKWRAPQVPLAEAAGRPLELPYVHDWWHTALRGERRSGELLAAGFTLRLVGKAGASRFLCAEREQAGLHVWCWLDQGPEPTLISAR